MIHDGPANYTRHGKTISVSRFLLLTLPAVDPVFCPNRRNYLREKIAKNPIFPFSSRASFPSFPLSFFFLPPERKYAPVIIRYFAPIIFLSSCSSSSRISIGITKAIRYKSRV